MKRLINLLLSILTAVILTGCDDEPTTPSTGVVEGYINSQGTCVVWFSATASPQNNDDITDKVLKWGKVTISDGTSEVVLRGQPVSNNFPPFRFYATDIDVRPGVTYTVTATYKDFMVTGSSRMTTAPKIDNIEILPVEGKDSLRAINLYFTAPEDVPAYYYVTMRSLERFAQEDPCMLSAICVEKAGEQIRLPVYNPKTYRISKHYQTNIKAGQKVLITLYRINKDVYEFWKVFFDNQLFGASPVLGNNKSLPGTVEGGYGVWSAQGGDAAVVFVE